MPGLSCTRYRWGFGRLLQTEKRRMQQATRVAGFPFFQVTQCAIDDAHRMVTRNMITSSVTISVSRLW